MRDKKIYRRVREWLMDTLFEQDVAVSSLPSERQMSEMLGVSRVTVRRVLADLRKEKLLKPQARKGTLVRQRPVEGHKRRKWTGATVGVLFFDGTARTNSAPSLYAWGILRSALNELCGKGIRAQLITVPDTGLIAAREIMSYMPSGLIWISPDKCCAEIIGYAKDKGVPVVAVGGALDDKRAVHYLCNDDEAGGFMAGEYLLKRGHHEILVTSRTENRPFTMDRYTGFVKALAKFGFKHSPDMLIAGVADNVRDVYRDLRERIRGGQAGTAICAIDGIYYKAVCAALSEERKAVPDDYSLVTLDQIPPEDLATFTPVQIGQDLEGMGRNAVKLLLDTLSGKRSIPSSELFPPILVEGDSCRKIKWTQEGERL